MVLIGLGLVIAEGDYLAEITKSARRMFVEALTLNWQRAREAYMPDGPTTRDERFVWNAIRMARSEDVRSILEAVTDFKSRPNADPDEWFTLPGMAEAWLKAHPEWARGNIAPVVAEAVNDLRTFKRDRRAENARKRYTSRSYGHRRTVRHRGPLPPITVKVPKVGAAFRKRK
jgi:hypothetical protein